MGQLAGVACAAVETEKPTETRLQLDQVLLPGHGPWGSVSASVSASASASARSRLEKVVKQDSFLNWTFE